MYAHNQIFLGADYTYEEADFTVFGAPYDGTCSYRPGTRFGPQAARDASDGLETYSPYQKRDFTEFKVHDAGDLELFPGMHEESLKLIEETEAKHLADGKCPIMIGGEHSLTYATVKAALAKYPELHIIHIDAHCDLLDDFMGNKLSHGAVMRRASEFMHEEKGRIHSFGIRSGTAEEWQYAAEKIDMHPFSLAGLKDVIAELKQNETPVYLSIDLDVLDPSVFPGTGTPEPGGIDFNELLKALLAMKEIKIIAADIMELSPHYDHSNISDVTAAKVFRELLIAIGRGREEN